jgi:hypothetical protein
VIGFHDVFYSEQSRARLNGDYSWKRFRLEDIDKVVWLFRGLGSFVRKVLQTAHISQKSRVVRLHAASPLKGSSEEIMHDYYKRFFTQGVLTYESYKDKQLSGSLMQARLVDYKSLTKSKKFNFIKFFFDKEYSIFHDNLMFNYLSFASLLSYGCLRNGFLSSAFLSRPDYIELFRGFRDNFVRMDDIYNKFKSKTFFLDKTFFYFKLPSWMLHKDLFSYQIVDATTKYKQYEDNIERGIAVSKQDVLYIYDMPSIPEAFIFFWFAIPIYSLVILEQTLLCNTIFDRRGKFHVLEIWDFLSHFFMRFDIAFCCLVDTHQGFWDAREFPSYKYASIWSMYIRRKWIKKPISVPKKFYLLNHVWSDIAFWVEECWVYTFHLRSFEDLRMLNYSFMLANVYLAFFILGFFVSLVHFFSYKRVKITRYGSRLLRFDRKSLMIFW